MVRLISLIKSMIVVASAFLNNSLSELHVCEVLFMDILQNATVTSSTD